MDNFEDIQVVCHRGANRFAPENTFSAAELCLDWGVDYLEIDVRMSGDGVLYDLHDSSVDRTTDGHGEGKDRGDRREDDVYS